MQDEVLRRIMERIVRLERTTARLRVGEVTGTGPLDVALGGADISYEDVAAIGPVAAGDQVAALVQGNDLLVLGPISDGSRLSLPVFTVSSGAMASGAESAGTISVAHGLGVAPVAVLGGLQDGSWSHQVQWRWSADATNVTIKFRNPGPLSATATLKFVVVAP